MSSNHTCEMGAGDVLKILLWNIFPLQKNNSSTHKIIFFLCLNRCVEGVLKFHGSHSHDALGSGHHRVNADRPEIPSFGAFGSIKVSWLLLGFPTSGEFQESGISFPFCCQSEQTCSLQKSNPMNQLLNKSWPKCPAFQQPESAT